VHVLLNGYPNSSCAYGQTETHFSVVGSAK